MTLEEQLCFALYNATNAVIRTYRPWLREIGLTYPQYLVLLVLWQNGELTMGDIATRLALPQGGITPIVEKLEEANLIVRRRDKGDRRIVSVELTDSGANLESAANEAQRRVACATTLSEEEAADLRSKLQNLNNRLTCIPATNFLDHETAGR
ncbi:MAG: MarR family transcriptional regulator [Deltaproteobacteria bacterium]|nr:MAG: MarR family transcriptional regulator [Deltaproteobacteria bacterium]